MALDVKNKNKCIRKNAEPDLFVIEYLVTWLDKRKCNGQQMKRNPQ